jgi:hypothetical protein
MQWTWFIAPGNMFVQFYYIAANTVTALTTNSTIPIKKGDVSNSETSQMQQVQNSLPVDSS